MHTFIADFDLGLLTHVAVFIFVHTAHRAQNKKYVHMLSDETKFFRLNVTLKVNARSSVYNQSVNDGKMY